MLVLGRKVGERILIGEHIEVVVVEVKGETVRLGIDAPDGVLIYRQELYEAIERENQEARNLPSALNLKKMAHASKL